MKSDRFIAVAEGMTSNRLFNKISSLLERGRVHSRYANLDVVKSIRKPDHDYLIWIRDRKDDIPELTLEEHLLYHLRYLNGNEGCLSLQNVACCAGSQFPDGKAPMVGWRGKYFCVW